MRAWLLLVTIVTATAVAEAARAADPLDGHRLFTTAAERERLQALRAERAEREARRDGAPEESGRAASGGGSAARAAPQPEPPPRVDLRGFVRRSGGPDAVWVNDGSTLSGETLEGDIRVRAWGRDGSTVRITLPDGRTIRLKPGQTWDPETGRVRDSYRGD